MKMILIIKAREYVIELEPIDLKDYSEKIQQSGTSVASKYERKLWHQWTVS